MDGELILCVPGPWQNRNEFGIALSLSEPKGRFLFAVNMLADTAERDFIPVDFHEYEGNLSQSFFRACRGKMKPEQIEALAANKNCVFLHFPEDCEAQLKRIVKFTDALKNSGGYAVKIEPLGPAHNWETWGAGFAAQSIFYRYQLLVMLLRDVSYHFSMGMRYFGMPDAEVSVDIDIRTATELLEQFNFWRISTHADIRDGLTYSVTPESPFYMINIIPDHRYDEGSPFRNPHGICRLKR